MLRRGQRIADDEDVDKRFLDDASRDDRYSFDLERRGVSKTFYDSNKMVLCPSCGKSFSLFYSRVKLCTGCPQSISGCENARCVYCDTEFPLNDFMSKASSRVTSNYLGSVVKRYQDTFGERIGR